MLSIAAHLCALLVLAELPTEARFPAPSSADDGPAPQVTLFVRREPAARIRAAAIRSAPLRVRAVRPTAAPVRRPRPQPQAPTDSAGPARPAVRPAVWFKQRPALAARPLAAIVVPLASRALAAPAMPVPTPASIAVLIRPPTMPPSATPTPQRTPAPTTAPTAVAAANFGGLFSQNYPPAFSAAAQFDAIRSQLSRPVHIRVNVDETGRATGVQFIQPVTDPALAQAVRAALLALQYVPADCNGLHCEGTLEIAY